jgi:hypothetical protein
VPFTPAGWFGRWALYVGIGTAAGLLLAVVVCIVVLIQARRQVETARTTLDEVLATHFYQTYLNLTLLADGAEFGAYNERDRYELLNTVVGMLDRADLQLNRLADAGARRESAEVHERYRQLSRLLRTQATELRAYWRTDDRAHARRFDSCRQEAWDIIRELMEVQE